MFPRRQSRHVPRRPRCRRPRRLPVRYLRSRRRRRSFLQSHQHRLYRRLPRPLHRLRFHPPRRQRRQCFRPCLRVTYQRHRPSPPPAPPATPPRGPLPPAPALQTHAPYPEPPSLQDCAPVLPSLQAHATAAPGMQARCPSPPQPISEAATNATNKATKLMLAGADTNPTRRGDRGTNCGDPPTTPILRYPRRQGKLAGARVRSRLFFSARRRRRPSERRGSPGARRGRPGGSRG